MLGEGDDFQWYFLIITTNVHLVLQGNKYYLFVYMLCNVSALKYIIQQVHAGIPTLLILIVFT
jgi:hypothetical protein